MRVRRMSKRDYGFKNPCMHQNSPGRYGTPTAVRDTFVIMKTMKAVVWTILLCLLQSVAAWQSDSLKPFHHAFPVHDLPLAKRFYGEVLGLTEGRSSKKWQDYSLDGHQIVCHLVTSDYRCQDFYNPVDGDRVPVPHTGLAMTVEQFQLFADRLRNHGVDFIIEPHLRFQGQPGEQWTMFFKDPSGNNLEFKAMTNASNLFAKYNVDEFDYGAAEKGESTAGEL